MDPSSPDRPGSTPAFSSLSQSPPPRARLPFFPLSRSNEQEGTALRHETGKDGQTRVRVRLDTSEGTREIGVRPINLVVV